MCAERKAKDYDFTAVCKNEFTTYYCSKLHDKNEDECIRTVDCCSRFMVANEWDRALGAQQHQPMLVLSEPRQRLGIVKNYLFDFYCQFILAFTQNEPPHDSLQTNMLHRIHWLFPFCFGQSIRDVNPSSLILENFLVSPLCQWLASSWNFTCINGECCFDVHCHRRMRNKTTILLDECFVAMVCQVQLCDCFCSQLWSTMSSWHTVNCSAFCACAFQLILYKQTDKTYAYTKHIKSIFGLVRCPHRPESSPFVIDRVGLANTSMPQSSEFSQPFCQSNTTIPSQRQMKFTFITLASSGKCQDAIKMAK